MKLSTRSRYGTRMILKLAEAYDKGPLQIGEIANQLDVSVKYLEQLIIPLKKANLITSFRGPKGGHRLAKSPAKVTVGEIVRILEGGINLTECVADPDVCDKNESCITRRIWEEASKAMYQNLNSVTLSSMIEKGRII